MNTTTTATATSTTAQVSCTIPAAAGQLTAVTSPDNRTAATAAIHGLCTAAPEAGMFTTVSAYLRKSANANGRHTPGFDAVSIMERLGLSAYGRRRVGTLSTEVRALADLAATVCGAPHRIALANPTAGLDAVNTRRVMELLADLAAARCTVVIATDDIEWADTAADTVVVLVNGTAVAQGNPAELRARHHGPSTVSWTAVDGVHEHRTRTPGAVVAELEAHFGQEVHTIAVTPPTLTDAVEDLARTYAV
ncbi:ABC-type multidrug transport system ATPase subunit [Nakamurella sp. UYEF19]|uniref:hypothetical protein n=1 Tax=Nakamurella sp. UYEF19 TaxID=1756392 RepID=UPI0033926B55